VRQATALSLALTRVERFTADDARESPPRRG
jgi:hypothetical protein